VWKRKACVARFVMNAQRMFMRIQDSGDAVASPFRAERWRGCIFCRNLPGMLKASSASLVCVRDHIFNLRMIRNNTTRMPCPEHHTP